MSNDAKPEKPPLDRIPPGRFFGLGYRMLDERVTVDFALEFYMETCPDADPVVVRAEMEAEEATMASTTGLFGTLGALGAWLKARETDPDAPYEGPKIPLSESEYVLLLYGSSRAPWLILKNLSWNDASASAAANQLVRRGLAEFVPAERPELTWETRDGVAMALVATALGMAAYESQDHDAWAMEEQGYLRRPPEP